MEPMKRNPTPDPWANCFLTRMLVVHLRSLGKENDVDYHGILSSGYPGRHFDDSKAFLENPNHWVPHAVLQRLILQAEVVTGRKDAAYVAAKNYFYHKQRPSFIEIISKHLAQVDAFMRLSSLWAVGYTNYLRMQCLPIPGQPEVILLSQFQPNTVPQIGDFYLLNGLCEGLPALFDDTESVTCQAVFSQLTLAQVVEEFKNYSIRQDGDTGIIIMETASQREVATAKKICLKTEIIPDPEWNDMGSQEWVLPPHRQQVTLLSQTVDPSPSAWQADHGAYEVVREGTLYAEGLSFLLRKGHRFNAPYARVRFQWRPKWRQKIVAFTRRRSEVVPFLLEHMRELRTTHLQSLQYLMENQALTQANLELKTTQSEERYGIIGESPVMRKLLEHVRLVGPTDATVLLTGETGTGKDLLARALHASSLRGNRTFHAINCGAFTDTLLEAELFGYEKGAFTGALSQKPGLFEVANGGTVFLDEVGDCSPAMQVKLLRVIETQELYRVGGRKPIMIDVRLIAATHKDLSAGVDAGQFRQDLFYRLHVIPLRVPPLRERREDIPPFIDHFVQRYAQTHRKEQPLLTNEARELLYNHGWPGNVRQLKNVVERAIVFHTNRTIRQEDIALPEAVAPAQGAGQSLQEALDIHKRKMIETALQQSGGNKTKAAALLGIQRTHLSRLIHLLDISI